MQYYIFSLIISYITGHNAIFRQKSARNDRTKAPQSAIIKEKRMTKRYGKIARADKTKASENAIIKEKRKAELYDKIKN